MTSRNGQASGSKMVTMMSLIGVVAPITGQIGFQCSLLEVVGTGPGADCQ
ncbi:hypothetical protein BS17DRAFT_697161 [Gyrodon lividus]|nr:hypothetical protein BS17DRAFT_697161 [Gyrodon lividus]